MLESQRLQDLIEGLWASLLYKLASNILKLDCEDLEIEQFY